MKTKSVDTCGWEGWEGGHKQEEERDPSPSPGSLAACWAHRFQNSSLSQALSWALPNVPNVRTVITSPLQGPWHLWSPALSSPPTAQTAPRSSFTRSNTHFLSTNMYHINQNILLVIRNKYGEDSPALLEAAYSLTLKCATLAQLPGTDWPFGCLG